jgi:hypothetical protein
VALNVFLSRKVRVLRLIEDSLRAEGSLKVGEVVPALQGKDLNGQPVSFAYDSRFPTVIYVLSPTCAWCKRNEANVEALAINVVGKYRFLAVSLSSDGLRQYAESAHISFPLYSDLQVSTLSAYKFGGTPQTIVVSPEGKVLKNWKGAYIDEVKEEVESYFAVRLPGIRETT